MKNFETKKIDEHADIMSQDPPKPFVKWVGGKRQLLLELISRLPDDFCTYVEPFVGGGALMWEVALKRPSTRIVINDANKELINTYRVVRDDPEKLLDSLSKHINDERYYYAVRDMDRQPWWPMVDPITRASRFIYLNRTGYNGLWRVNRKGQCNVPFGRYKNPRYDDRANIMACSRVLERASVSCGDFLDETAAFAKSGAFYYFDPPYVPVSNTADFTGYTQNGFGLEQQKRLRDFCVELDRKGVRFMLSNSDTQIVRELYEGFVIETVSATRTINSNPTGRGKINEVIVRNY